MHSLYGLIGLHKEINPERSSRLVTRSLRTYSLQYGLMFALINRASSMKSGFRMACG
jgi:hypothetical protein